MNIPESWFRIPLNGKIPTGPWRNYTREQIEKLMWKGNFGLDCEKSGLRVVDCDTQEALEKAMEVCDPTGFIVETPRGGRHLYYEAVEGEKVRNRQNMMGVLGLDLRADGGYVVAPGSVVNGRRYKIRMNEGLAKWNKEWFPQEEYQPVAIEGAEGSVFRARRYISRISAAKGSRDNTAFKVACVLIQKFGLSPEAALEELKAWNAYKATPPLPEKRLEYKIGEAIKLSHSR